MTDQRSLCFRVVLVLTGVLASTRPAVAEQGYLQHNLVSDVAGAADRTDPQLVNSWGLARSAAGPWWVNASGPGLSLVYDGSGLAFPTPAPPPGVTGSPAPTGTVKGGTA